jgi:2'-5' RNA ligase
MTDALRLFVGIDVGEAWSQRLSVAADSLRDSLGRGVRWVRPELYDLTVVFLGNQDENDVDQIAEALARAALETLPFQIHLTHLHRLGGHEHGALVAGVDERSGSLQALRSRLDRELRQRDISFDAKRLVPHVTLGRPRGRGTSLSLAAVDLSDTRPLLVLNVNLVKSIIGPSGSTYETIRSARLGSQKRYP